MLYLTAGAYRKSPHCGYCNGCNTSFSFGFHLGDKLSFDEYQSLIDRGYRRSGVYVYKPDLKRSCCPQYTIRLEADKFVVTREHKKLINRFNRYVSDQEKKNRPEKGKYNEKFDLIKAIHNSESENFYTTIDSNAFTHEKFQLFKLYQTRVHNDEEGEVTEDSFKRFLCSDPFTKAGGADDRFGAFHQLYYYKGKLIAIGVIDILPKCISSVYLIWHPDYATLGLGKLAILREISLCVEYKIPYYYLGFYIHNCQKMRYKGSYTPSYLLEPNFGEGEDLEWIEIEKYKAGFDKRKYVSMRDIEEDEEEMYIDDYDPPHLIDINMPGTLSRTQLEHQLKKSNLDLKQVPIILRYAFDKIQVTYDELTEESKPIAMHILEDIASGLGVELMKKTTIVL